MGLMSAKTRKRKGMMGGPCSKRKWNGTLYKCMEPSCYNTQIYVIYHSPHHQKAYCPEHFREKVFALTKTEYLACEYTTVWLNGKRVRNFWRATFWNKNKQVLPENMKWMPDKG